jgi:hypothetical protein
MKAIRLLLAALLPLVPAGNAPAEPKPAPWLVAQRMASCEVENRKVPVGTRLCSGGSLLECSPSGTWVSTGKEC